MLFYLLPANFFSMFPIADVPDVVLGTATVDESEESDVPQEGGSARGQGGKKDERWIMKFDIHGSDQELLD